MQRIFQSELEGLVLQFGHRVSLGLIPADGVRVVDALNDFELTETGRYKLPNLQAGSPFDIVVQLRVGPQLAGSVLRLLDLRLGFTPTGEESAEVVKAAFTIEFIDSVALSGLTENYEVAKAVQFLMNARARREAMQRIDMGDFAGARNVIYGTMNDTRAALAAVGSAPSVLQELASLEEAALSLTDRVKDRLNRKKLAYNAYSRRTGK
jgi:Ca-activated chloride channel family protein